MKLKSEERRRKGDRGYDTDVLVCCSVLSVSQCAVVVLDQVSDEGYSCDGSGPGSQLVCLKSMRLQDGLRFALLLKLKKKESRISQHGGLAMRDSTSAPSGLSS